MPIRNGFANAYLCNYTRLYRYCITMYILCILLMTFYSIYFMLHIAYLVLLETANTHGESVFVKV